MTQLAPRILTLILSTVCWVSLMGTMETLGARSLAAADQPAPVATQSTHELYEGCQNLVKEWISTRNEAQRQLGACRLHAFNDACVRLTEARKKAADKDSPCLKIPGAKEKVESMPELNCNIVKVPESCAGEAVTPGK